MICTLTRAGVAGPFAVLLAVASPALAGQTYVIPVAEDVSLNELTPDGQLGTITTRGGLLAGYDTVGSFYTFLLKFELPELDGPSPARRSAATTPMTLVAASRSLACSSSPTIRGPSRPSPTRPAPTAARRSAGSTSTA